jgi:2'-5' RNA ligase
MTAATKRVFFAITPDPRTRGDLQRLLAALRETASAGPGALRWVEPERLHLTLQFLAHAPVERLAELAALGARVAAAEPGFVVGFGGLDAFPELRRARVLWLGVRAGAEPLARLAAALGAGLAALGLPVEERAFTPHLTLARSREPRACQPLAERASALPELGFRVHELVLYESELGAGPARYVPLNRFGLG